MSLAGGVGPTEPKPMIVIIFFLATWFLACATGGNDNFKGVASLFARTAASYRTAITRATLTKFLGGLIYSRQIAETMGHKITALNHGQGFSANLATGIFVIVASLFGLPVSTAHVSVGSLFGIGLGTKQSNPRLMRNIALSWIITLPCAALLSAGSYALLRQL